MGELLNIITKLHKSNQRDYIGRMTNDKIHCMQIAKKYGQNYWDGDRKYGYGGFKYDGRWETVAKDLIEQYNLKTDAKILDVGCGKGFLLFELKKLLPDATIVGYDISKYAIENSKEEVKEVLEIHRAQEHYDFEDSNFDLVISITTIHNLNIYDLKSALKEIERVGKENYIVVEGYRNETELFNLQCWALTCESFFTPDEWEWLFNEFGYTGDYEFIYF